MTFRECQMGAVRRFWAVLDIMFFGVIILKKTLAILVATILAAMSLPFSASAASTEGYYTYEVSGGQATIVDVDESISGYVIVPTALGGYPVTTIGANAFSYCNNITKVAVPGCVKTIGKSAFTMTSGLTEAVFCSGVKTIGEYCFDYSSVVKIYLPVSVDTIGYAAWNGAAVFYEGTEEQLQQINRPNKGTITDIFKNASINYNQIIPTVNFTDETYKVLSEGYYTFMISGGEATIIDVDESISGYVIVPATLGGYTVTTIGANAFSYCSNITKVAVPGCVKTIGKSAFTMTSGLTEAVFCSGVKTIGEYCFDYSSVVKIYLPVSVDTIGYAAWSGAAILYEGTEEQLLQINRPDEGTITDIFADGNISYNQTIPEIENNEPSTPDSGEDVEEDNGFDFGSIFSAIIAFFSSVINFIMQLFA